MGGKHETRRERGRSNPQESKSCASSHCREQLSGGMDVGERKQ